MSIVAASAESDGIVGDSAALRAALDDACLVSPTDATVLLLGETGTGKERFARAIHARSRRQHGPMVCVNCAALPPALIESELFGHERGAFTGAIATRRGRFELADGGTIFLDEIGDLPLDLQAKLLRVLQEREYERVGSPVTRNTDVRVIAATNADLSAAVTSGRFRADLYYRLSVFPIELPPLRHRRDDIPVLTWHVIRERQHRLRRHITEIPDPQMGILRAYDWPGNIRELENVVERAMICAVDHRLYVDENLLRGRRSQPADGTLASVEKAHIETVLSQCGGRINGAGNAAERLGLHPNTLRFRIKRLGIKRKRHDESSTAAHA
ncbi:MAG TPA: sigma 54-interacting transcriptional regulator [Vicinamibacterales bacterium]|nr:sigma 54-interacting transcriptional regulator [Vicinamibacterales bacterium]